MSKDLFAGGKHAFRAYGLTFSSEIRFAHVPETAFTGNADVHICRGEVFGPAYTPPAKILVESSPGRLLIRGARSASILVSGGERIVIEPLPDGDLDAIRQLVLGWALGGIFHQRGMLPLHASALCDGKGCFIFCAASGVGKSTLAAAFLNEGFTYLDDNVALVDFGHGAPFVVPGAPELRLWDDALPLLEFEHQVVGPIRSGLPKRSVVAYERFHFEAEPLRRVYILRRTNNCEPTFTVLVGMVKFQALMEHVFGLRLANDPASRGRLFRLVRELAAKVEVTEVRLPMKGFAPGALCRLLLTRGM
jgi:hypothetical protein